MSDIISFPGLGLEFTLNRVAFSIGNFPIYWYAILISAGFALGMLFVFKNVKEFGLDADRVIDVVLVASLAGIAGARIYYVALEWDRYKDNLLEIFNFRNGGLAIYGALIFGLIAAYFMCKWRKVKLLPLLDTVFGAVFVGQAIGRWGNFINMEAFGTNTNLPWGMTSNTISNYIAAHSAEQLGAVMDAALPVHPTFLYESLWCAAGFLLYCLFFKKRKFDGEMFLFYTGWYGFGRMIIEGLRTDSLWLGTMRASQVLAGLLFVASVITWVIVRSKIKRENDPEFLKLYKFTEESRLIVAGEYDYKSGMSKAAAAEEADAQADADDAQAELDDAQAELDDAQAELDDTQAETDDAQAELDDAQAELDDAQAEADDAQAERDDAQAEADDAQAELDDAQAENVSDTEKTENGKAK